MKPTLILLILVSVALSSGSQIILKWGMTSPHVVAALRSGNLMTTLLGVATSPFVVGGLFCFGLSALVWLFVLARVPLSTAYPFVALGIVVTVLAGRFIFGEAVPLMKGLGAGSIILGIFLVALA